MVASCLLFVPPLFFFVKKNKCMVHDVCFFSILVLLCKGRQTCGNILSIICPTIVILCKGKQAYGSILSTVFPIAVHPAVIILDKLKKFRKVYMSKVAVVAIPPYQAKSDQTEIKLHA